MQVLNPRFNIDSFFGAVASADETALLLDYDGTLAPFRPERDKAIPYDGIRERLDHLNRLSECRLVIISGRATAELVPLLGMERQPEIWGCHGGERLLPDGTITITSLSDSVRAALTKAEKWAIRHNFAQQFERKPTGAAFHWRGLPDEQARAIRSEVESRWAAEAPKHGLMLCEFDGGLELRAAGIGKGHAVTEIIDRLTDSTPVAYLGDDKTDEDAFAALGSRGLSTLVRPELRETKADLWIQPPDELLTFLDRWIADRS
ncbi:MAG: trehalose-phosphatase [Candidatus Zixiibacteriota bacterium]|nr:MAG: trehalose-phosphatase [candidate division Zixibacteria bacterium]